MTCLDCFVCLTYSFFVSLAAYFFELVEVLHRLLNVLVLKVDGSKIVIQSVRHTFAVLQCVFEVWNCLDLFVCFRRLLVTDCCLIVYHWVFFASLNSGHKFWQRDIVASHAKVMFGIGQRLTVLRPEG